MSVPSAVNQYKKLSIIIPCYNEAKTLKAIVKKVLGANTKHLTKELVIVNDCSTDNSLEIAQALAKKHKEVVIKSHEKNQGKGTAVTTGFAHCSGDIIVIQDADLEYNPDEYAVLLDPILTGKASVVYGSRFLRSDAHRVLHFWHTMGNKMLTFFSNMFSDIYLTDMETCYKMFTREVIKDLQLKEKRFGLEPEITAKIAGLVKRENLQVFEVAISYRGRTYEEGKKIRLIDGFEALFCILKYNDTLLSKFVKYVLAGSIVALSQFIPMVLMVELLNLSPGLPHNLANFIAIECSIITGYFLHKNYTWLLNNTKNATYSLTWLKFHLISFAGLAFRILLFPLLEQLGVNYFINMLLGGGMAIIWNFIGYNQFVFRRIKKMKSSTKMLRKK